MNSSTRPVVISGASITNDAAWPTWATWIQKRYNLKKVDNVSIKGLGNEAILLKAVNTAFQYKNPIIVVQLTNVDKWDWYVQSPELVEKINKEKHPITKLTKSDLFGFWSTGSHFPKWKEYYKDNYYSLEFHSYRTLQLIQWFQLLSSKQGWRILILFDSPILSVTEEQLNSGILTKDQCYQTTLIENTISKHIFNSLDLTQIYMPGLIGYACLNNMPWYSKKYKCHPDSLVHYHYAKEVVCKELDNFIKPVNEFETFLDEAIKFKGLVI